MSDIIITPNRGSTNAPTIQFSGSVNASASIRLEVLPEGQVAFLGKSGSLFSIADSMIGSLMAVSDISGLPILEVFSDDKVVMGKYNTNTLVVTGSQIGVGKSNPTSNTILDISGSVVVTGSLNVTTSITSSLLGTASYARQALTASYAVTASYALSVSGTSGSSGTSGANGSSGSTGSSGTSGAGTLSGGTANYVARFTGATTLSTGQIYDDNTNVAIGKTTPINAKLDINGNTIVTGSLIVASGNGNNDSTTITPNKITITDPFGTTDTGLFVSSSNAAGRGFLCANIVGVRLNTTGTSGNLYLGTLGDASAITINSSGNIGVAKTSGINAKLDINGNTIISGSLSVTGSLNVTNGSGNAGISINAGTTSNYGTIGFYQASTGKWDAGVEATTSNFYISNTPGFAGVGYILYLDRTNSRAAINKTTAPNATLDVNGNTIISGSLSVTGNITGTIVAAAPDFSPIFMTMGA